MLHKSLLAVLVTGVLVSGVQAAEVQPNGYLFGNVGRSDAEKMKLVKEAEAEFREVAVDNGLQMHSSFDGKDTAYKVGAGLQLNRHVGVEFQYTDLGQVDYKAGLTDGTNTLTYKLSGKTKGYGANLVGTLPFDQFKLFGKVGYHKLKTKASERVLLNGGLMEKDSDSANEWVTSFGVGAAYAFTRQIELVAEYERYSDVADEYDVDFASVGLRYNF